jgi:iron uptake system component EfeO
VAAVVAFAGAAVLGACSSEDEGGEAIPIVSTATTCEVGQTQLTAGKHTFSVNNRGSEVTEVYVYAPGDKVVTEKEHIGPGTSAKFSADLKAGRYEIACKPGEKGSGIRQTVTVS